MNSNSWQLRALIERLKTVGFFSRLFQWKIIRNQLVDAAAELRSLEERLDSLTTDKQSGLTEISIARNNFHQASAELNKYMSDVAVLSQQLRTSQAELLKSKEQVSKLLAEEAMRRAEHNKATATLHAIQQTISQERKAEIESAQEMELQKLRSMKETWGRHEELVKQTVKAIAGRNTIEYIDKVPFNGEPDNVLQICGEYVVLDSKSPAGEDLGNFSSYLKDQAERAVKYAKQENVRRDLFFIVPSNTLGSIKTFVHRMGDYTVYVISVDGLEPILLSLKKIEEYEFVKDLGPEERENICRIIGQFGHLAKRRVQVDNFFAKQFIQLAYKCESDLPVDIYQQASEFERMEKLNPPVEKRAKSINLKELGNEIARVKDQAVAKGIVLNDVAVSSRLNDLPLYEE